MLYIVTSFVIAGGVMIAVECKAWAENIEHDSMERKGIAHFEVKLIKL